MFAVSFVVSVEPAPTDLLFPFLLGSFFFGGLRFSAIAALLGFCLLFYNIGGVTSYIQVMDKPHTGMFVITSIYMSLSALVLCLMMSAKPERHFATITSGWLLAAFFASVLGLAGAFDVLGSGAKMSLAGRAMGLFKDPNVFSTYLIFPILVMIQRLVLGSGKAGFLFYANLLTCLAAIFLAFSRGAWFSLALSIILLGFLTFVMATENRVRSRVIVTFLVGAVLGTLSVGILLSIPSIWELAQQRLSLHQSYDVGETGRFGNQLNSLPVLLQRPFGFGPLQFGEIYHQDPHNTFINSFGSYGWLGGITYFLFIALTIVVGFRTVFIQSPFRNIAAVVFCPLLATILQGVQIDTDHWRHFYWLMGMMWGTYVATLNWRAARWPAMQQDTGH